MSNLDPLAFPSNPDEEKVAPAKTWDKVISLCPAGPLIIAVRKGFASMTIWESILGSFHSFFLLGILAYNADDCRFTLEQIQGELPCGGNKIVPKGLNAFRAYFHAARQLNPLYSIPPFFFVSLLIFLDSSAELMLKSKLIRSIWNHTYAELAEQFNDPRWLRDITLDARPLLLTWCALVPPVGIIFMLTNTGQTIWRAIMRNDEGRKTASANDCLVLRQNIDLNRQKPKEFYNSTWFNVALTLPYVFAVPTMITLWLYFNLGVDALLGFPSQDPHFRKMIVIIGLYIYGLSICLTVLFMRSYFTLCWNFTSAEYDLELHQDMIKRLPIKGWFLDFLKSANREPPSQIYWKDLVAVKYSTASLTIDNTKPENALLSGLKKLATFYESLSKKMLIHTDTLELRSSSGRTMDIRLWELSAAEKLKIFEALRTHCPSVYLDDAVQNALVGSSVMKEPQYTQIWFSVLTGADDKVYSGQLSAGQVLNKGKYTVGAIIASGGQAVLYSAKSQDEQEVVLKEFQLTPGESFNATIESAKDFENESTILGQISHEGIVKMLDMFYESGRVYIVLEQVHGNTLRQLVAENGALPAGQILALVRQICSVLEYLHNLVPPVVHRDFTPDNIILQKGEKIKLIDFSVSERKQKKAKADCAGKHSYTPPEQFAGAACPQSDIYALGATLFFLATAKDPLPITKSSLPISNTEDEKVLDRIIERCTELDLSDRYESTEWLINDLSNNMDA